MAQMTAQYDSDYKFDDLVVRCSIGINRCFFAGYIIAILGIVRCRLGVIAAGVSASVVRYIAGVVGRGIGIINDGYSAR